MHKVKGFSFHKINDKDVIDYIDEQPNGSKYIWGLVRKDMKEKREKKDNEDSNMEDMIMKCIEKYLKNIELPTNVLESKQINIDAEEIKNILGM